MRRALPLALLAAAGLAAAVSASGLEESYLGASLPFSRGDFSRIVRPAVPEPPVQAAAEDEDERPSDELLSRAAPWRTPLHLARLPLLKPGEPFRFEVVGDVEPGRFFWSRWLFNRKGMFRKQLAEVTKRNPGFILQLGDLVSRGVEKNYGRLYDDLEAVRPAMPFLPVIGNHDRLFPHGEQPADFFTALFGPVDYHFDVGGIRFIAIDSSLERLSESQLVWLDRLLDFPGPKVVYTHMPPVSFKGWTFGVTGIKEGEDRFLEILARRKVDRVYCGHIHGFGQAEKDGVRFLLTGGGGSPLYPLPFGEPELFHHTVSVEAGPQGLRETVHPAGEAPFLVKWPDGGDFERLVWPSPAVASAHGH